MNNSELELRLAEHGVRPTALRILVLSAIEKAGQPISALDIERALDTVDRSTITRALSQFCSKGLVHIIDDGSGSAKYEACHACGHSEENHSLSGNIMHSDLHVHFHCTRCGRTFCLPSAPIPPIPLADGFIQESANFIISGLCPECSRK